MTSVLAGHIILTPTQPVGSERRKRSHDLLTRSCALYSLSYRVPEGDLILSTLMAANALRKKNNTHQLEINDIANVNVTRDLFQLHTTFFACSVVSTVNNTNNGPVLWSVPIVRSTPFPSLTPASISLARAHSYWRSVKILRVVLAIGAPSLGETSLHRANLSNHINTFSLRVNWSLDWHMFVGIQELRFICKSYVTVMNVCTRELCWKSLCFKVITRIWLEIILRDHFVILIIHGSGTYL